MRCADQPEVEEQVDIAAPADRVWPHVIDFNLMASVSDELVEVRWLDNGPALGARFVGVNRNRYFGEWETTSTVIACDPPRVFAWAVGDTERPNTTWWFTLDGTDAVTLTQRVRIGTGPSGLQYAIQQRPDKEERIVERRLEEFRAAMQANLDEIKRRAEAR
jgi:hypothetical protein